MTNARNTKNILSKIHSLRYALFTALITFFIIGCPLPNPLTQRGTTAPRFVIVDGERMPMVNNATGVDPAPGLLTIIFNESIQRVEGTTTPIILQMVADSALGASDSAQEHHFNVNDRNEVVIYDSTINLIFTELKHLATNSKYTLSIPQGVITNEAGNNVSTTISFTTAERALWPQLLNTDIRSSEGNTIVTLNFDRPITFDRESASIRILSGSGLSNVATITNEITQSVGTSGNNNQLILTVTGLLADGTYSISIPEGAIQDTLTVPNWNRRLIRREFTVGTDTTAPELADNPIPNPNDTTISIEFTESIWLVSAGGITLEVSNGGVFTKVPGTTVSDGTGGDAYVLMTIATTLDSGIYRIVIDYGAVQDAFGNKISAVNYEFTRTITDITDTTDTTSAIQKFTLKLHPSIPVANIQVSESEYTRFFHSFSFDIPSITKFLYTYFADDFDFIMFSYNELFPAYLRYHGLYLNVKNDTMGIGEKLYDNTSRYGSKEKLQGIIHFPYRSGLINGPGLHELMHRWGNDVISSVDSHWGFSSAGGQLGGFDLDTLTRIEGNRYKASVAGFDNFGVFANGGNAVPYSPIELYLAGLIPASEVPDIHVAVNPQWVLPGSEFTADRFEVYSIERIIKEHGARVPSSANSQKQFRVLFVVVSTGDLTDGEWEDIDRITSNFSFAGKDSDDSRYNFWEATGGRAIVQFSGIAESLTREIDTSLPDPESPTPMIDSPIVGTWLARHSFPDSNDLYVFEENGMYSRWSTLYPHPTDRGEYGTYSIVSDSAIRLCLDRIGGTPLNPQVCFDRPYRIVDRTLAFEPVLIPLASGPAYSPELSFVRQAGD